MLIKSYNILLILLITALFSGCSDNTPEIETTTSENDFVDVEGIHYIEGWDTDLITDTDNNFTTLYSALLSMEIGGNVSIQNDLLKDNQYGILYKSFFDEIKKNYGVYSYRVNLSFDDALELVSKNHPVLATKMLRHYIPNYTLLIGYDEKNQTILGYDENKGDYLHITKEEWIKYFINHTGSFLLFRNEDETYLKYDSYWLDQAIAAHMNEEVSLLEESVRFFSQNNVDNKIFSYLYAYHMIARKNQLTNEVNEHIEYFLDGNEQVPIAKEITFLQSIYQSNIDQSVKIAKNIEQSNGYNTLKTYTLQQLLKFYESDLTLETPKRLLDEIEKRK